MLGRTSYRYDRALGCMVECTKPVALRHGSTWPMVCVASGVQASQAGELREFFQKHGETVAVTADGDPVYTSSRQRKRLLELRGFVDKSAFC
jgi:hypothetical protein